MIEEPSHTIQVETQEKTESHEDAQIACHAASDDDDVAEVKTETKEDGNIYEGMETKELIKMFDDLIKEYSSPTKQIRAQVYGLRRAFENKLREVKKKKFEEFLAKGGSEVDFLYINPDIAQFEALYREYSEKLKAYREDAEKKQRRNLEIRHEIIEALKNLYLSPQPDDKPIDILNRFRKLKRRWRDAGKVHSSKSNDVYNTYRHHLENFYQYLKLNKALQETECKRNLEQRQMIISRAEALLVEPNIKKALNDLQHLHRLWKEDATPVADEYREPTWQGFKQLSKKIHARKGELVIQTEQKQQENLHKKRDLIEDIRALTLKIPDHPAQWQNLTHQAAQLQQSFLATGRVPQEENQNIWNTFKETVKTFHRKRREFYKHHKRKQHESLKKKMSLIAQAERLQESADWKETAQTFKKIQAEWKKSAHAPFKHSEKIWHRFQAACNRFFERYKAHHDLEEKEINESHDKKLEFLSRIKEFKLPSEEQQAVESINQLLDQWEALGKASRKKQEINTSFYQAIDQLIERSFLEEGKREKIRRRIKPARLIQEKDPDRLEDEIRKIRRQITDLECKLIQTENNIRFFSHADQNNPLVRDAYKKISRERQTLDAWKRRYRDLNNVRLNLPES